MPQPKTARKRTPAAKRKIDERRAELLHKRDEALRHIAALDQKTAELQRDIATISDARQQMFGRLRLIDEDLGEAPALTPAPALAEPEANGNGGGPPADEEE
jgi:chromosome segregation ATPase